MLLNKTRIHKNLLLKNKRSLGRNNKNTMTMYYRESGYKKLYKKITDITQIKKQYFVVNIEYNQNRSSFLMKILHKNKNNKFIFSYYTCNNSTNVLRVMKPIEKDTLYWKDFLNRPLYMLKNLDIGDIVSNIEKIPNKGPTFARSAGTFAHIVDMEHTKENWIRIQLPSKEHYFVSPECKVTVGQMSNCFYKYLKRWKAGVSRNNGKRPHTRGVAKNAVDHPHGGGKGKTGTAGQPVTPQGWVTKWVPTRKKRKNSFFIALCRKKNN